MSENRTVCEQCGVITSNTSYCSIECASNPTPPNTSPNSAPKGEVNSLSTIDYVNNLFEVKKELESLRAENKTLSKKLDKARELFGNEMRHSYRKAALHEYDRQLSAIGAE